MSGIIEWFKNIPENFKDFIIQHQHNPVLWIALFFGGLAVFFLTYKALHKKNDL